MIGIAFDLTGTLVADDGLEHKAFVRLLERLSSERGDVFDTESGTASADRFICALEQQPDEMAAILAGEAGRFLGEQPSAAVLAARFRQIATALVPDAARVLNGTRETLQRISSLRIPCAVLTNGLSTIEQCRAKWVGFEGPVLVAEDIGARKPARQAFDALVATLALPPDRIWYVGDDPQVDVDGASQAGLRTVWIRPAGTTYPPDLAAPDHAIERIEEVLAILSEPYTRSLLSLRYVLHNALAWRQGHFVPGVEYGLNDPASLTHVLPRQSDES
jgi:HAD superfamily hydrolase (TIGR01509 family)